MDFVADHQSGTGKISNLKILVVDDDLLSQRLMQVLLKREGCEVDLASNGMEAFEAIKAQKYDIVFMDLQMPGMGGLEASRRIREWENRGQHTFIVALTASYLPENGQALFDAGIDNYISKPFEIEHIQHLLKYSARSSGLNQSPGPGQGLPAETVLDIQKGIEQIGGDQETYRELLGDFIHELPERLQTIQRLFEAMDFAQLSRAAHNLSGIAANLGAPQLSQYAKRLDVQSSEGYTEAINSLLQQIQLEVGKLIEFSDNFLAEKK
jgi:two-component system sensor histidine kinase BarA